MIVCWCCFKQNQRKWHLNNHSHVILWKYIWLKKLCLAVFSPFTDGKYNLSFTLHHCLTSNKKIRCQKHYSSIDSPGDTSESPLFFSHFGIFDKLEFNIKIKIETILGCVEQAWQVSNMCWIRTLLKKFKCVPLDIPEL